MRAWKGIGQCAQCTLLVHIGAHIKQLGAGERARARARIAGGATATTWVRARAKGYGATGAAVGAHQQLGEQRGLEIGGCLALPGLVALALELLLRRRRSGLGHYSGQLHVLLLQASSMPFVLRANWRVIAPSSRDARHHAGRHLWGGRRPRPTVLRVDCDAPRTALRAARAAGRRRHWHTERSTRRRFNRRRSVGGGGTSADESGRHRTRVTASATCQPAAAARRSQARRGAHPPQDEKARTY